MSSVTLAQGSIMLEQFGEIRVTEDGRLSAYDLIRVIGGQKNPYQVWKRLVQDFEPELTNCEDWKFPGERQRNTPIVDKETALKIIGVLPGASGKKYRDLAAKLVLAYLENPDQLAKAAIARVEDSKQLEEIAQTARSKYLAKGYHPHMENIRERLDSPDDHFAYMAINKATTKAVTGKEPKQIQAERYQGLAKKPPSARQLLNDGELKLAENCHGIQSVALTQRDVQGTKDTVATCVEIAELFEDMLKKAGIF